MKSFLRLFPPFSNELPAYEAVQTDDMASYEIKNSSRSVMDDDQFSLHNGSSPAGMSPMMEEHLQPEGRRGDRLALYVTLSALGVFMIGTWIAVFRHGTSLGLFSGHPPLQTLAIVCFALGIMTLQPTSQPKSKASGLARHQLIVLGVGFPSILVGTVLIFLNKNVHESAHFTTWHATFGGIALVWMIVQILLGGLSVWFNGRALGGGMKAKGVWKYHRASGYLLFPMFLLTAVVGGNYSEWAANSLNLGVRILLYTIAPVVTLLGLWSRVRLSKMNFRN